MSKKKKTNSTKKPVVTKEIRIVRRPNFELTIGWNFSRMDNGGKLSCSLKLLHKYIDQLINLEDVSIADILAKPHNHPLGVDKLSRDAKARLEFLNIDVETLYQLDLKTPARLWGFLEGNIFYILWLDPKHEVYLCK